jgi:hypothetical protein
MDWQDTFVEDHWYQFLIPEVLYGQVHNHCLLAFPDSHVAFKGPGRVTAVDIAVLPMDTAGILYGLWSQRQELEELRATVRNLTRQVQLLEHNTAVITRELLSGHVLQEDELHPGILTPGTSYLTNRMAHKSIKNPMLMSNIRFKSIKHHINSMYVLILIDPFYSYILITEHTTFSCVLVKGAEASRLA